MNKNTERAIQRRLDRIHDVCENANLDGYDTQVIIGNNNFVFHFHHPKLEPFVLGYDKYGHMNCVGVIRNWEFLPCVQPNRRA